MLKQWLHRVRGHATTRIPVTVFTPSYAPELDGDPDPGEVVWAWIPYEDDPRQGKDRPVIVVGGEEKDLVVVPLTTKAHPERDDEVEVGSGGWDDTHRDSYAKVDTVLRVGVGDVRREGAVLDRTRFDKVVAAVAAYRAAHPGS
jgi:hypothetical protein